MILSISIFQLVNILLVIILLFLGFKTIETKWSYKISKPYYWESAIEKGDVSSDLITIEKTYRDKVRFYNFWFQIEQLKKGNIEGAFAELGVYKGETARMIHKMDESRTLHLFDTFEGFAKQDLDIEANKDEKYATSNFADTNLIEVKKFIDANERVLFHPGFFPETTLNLQEEKFAFVHLDADLYQPTLAALTYFYPRLSPGGIIIVHDYNHTWPGISKAIKEFELTIPECFIVLTDWQGSAMVKKNR
jgi:O-methyltransferase